MPNPRSDSSLLVSLLQRGRELAGSSIVRLDGWVNTLTGLGTSRDKTTATEFSAPRLLTFQELDALYHHDDMANRICSAVPEDAMREGFTVCNDGTSENEDNPSDDIEDENEDKESAIILARMNALEIPGKVKEAMIWARVQGAGGVVLLVEGAGLPNEPLDDLRITRITHLMVVDRGDLMPASYYQDITQPRYGEVETYYVMQSGDNGVSIQTQVVIHESRIVMFQGVTTSRREMRRNQGWRHSALQRIYRILLQTGTAWDSTIAMMQDMSQAVFKMVGFIDALAEADGTGEAAIQKRITLMDMVRSSIRAIVLDAGTKEEPGEDFKVVERSTVTGSDALLKTIFMRLSAAARMPYSILMSQTPTGLGQTGESELRWWYDIVRTCQTHEATPRLNRIAKIVAIEQGLSPDGWTVDFPPLWQMTPTEEAAYRLSVAQADTAYTTMGALLPEEICLSRWASGRYSGDMNLSKEDLDLRRNILKADLEKQEEDAINPPPPPPMPTPGIPNKPAAQKEPTNA